MTTETPLDRKTQFGAVSIEPHEDTVRLDWVLEHRLLRVQGHGDCWHVLDCRDGLTFLVQAAPSARAAIDQAREKLKGMP